MKKTLVSILLLVSFLTTPCFAATKKPFFGSTYYAAMSAATTYYLKFNRQGLNTTEANVEMRMPGSFTFSNLRAKTADPGGSNSIVYTLRVNGADTALTCTVTAGNTVCTDNTHNVSVVAGDRVCLKVVTSASLGGGYYITQFGVTATGSAANISLVSGSVGSASTSTTQYTHLGGGSWSSTENLRSVPMPTGGTLKNLTFGIDVAPGAGKSYTYTLRKNGSNTALTCAIADSNTSCIDSTNTVSVTAGDVMSVSVAPSGTPTGHSYTNYGMEFDPTTDGEAIHFLVTDNAPSNSAANNWGVFIGQWSSWNTSEQWAVQTYLPVDVTFKNLYVVANSAPGGSASWLTVLDKDFGATALTCTISGASTSCNDITHSDAGVAGSSIDMGVNPSLTPASTILKFGLVTYIAPPTTYSLILVNSSEE